MQKKSADTLMPLEKFILRLFKNMVFVIFLIGIALFAGMLGYHGYEKMSWTDAFVNASMILSGMGPVTTLNTSGGKIFAGFYALFSGLFFILIMGIVLSPIVHRIFHKVHLAGKKSAE